MEFRFRTSEERPSLFLPSSFPTSSSGYGYFAAEALRAGYIGLPDDIRRNDVLEGPISAREALHRELQKEQIREEIIAKEITQRRILEEEVRREMAVRREMERAVAVERVMAIERQKSAGRLSSLSDVPGIRAHLSDATPDQRLPLSAHAGVKKLTLPLNTEKSGIVSNLLSEAKLPTGTKRKAADLVKGGSGISQSGKKEWSCALCQVTATCEEGLNEHLQGRKHKAKEILLGANKTAGSSSVSDGQQKKAKKMNGVQKKQVGKKKIAHFWCEHCKVQCNSKSMFNSHLGGRKHKAYTEGSKNGDDPTAVLTSSGSGNHVVNEETNEVKAGARDNLDDKEVEQPGGGEVPGAEASSC